MKRLTLALLFAACVFAGLIAIAGDTDAASARTLPSLSLKTLEEKEVRLSDARFNGKIIVLAAFTTWNDISVRQAQALNAIYRDHPNVEIVAMIVDDLPAARDFRVAHDLKFPCYKSSDGPRVGTNLQRMFETKKNRQVLVNRVPFVIIADKDRKVAYAQFGLTEEKTLREKLAALR